MGPNPNDPIGSHSNGHGDSGGVQFPGELCGCVRGVSGVARAGLWDIRSGAPIGVGKVDLPHWWVGLGKLAELVAPAINECLLAAKQAPPASIPILLGVADKSRPHRFAGLDERLLEEVEFRLNLTHNPDSHVIARERISGVLAINDAVQIIESGRSSFCVVAGVDSFLQQAVVDAYNAQRRVLTPGNSNGFIPGEAGCAVLLTTAGDRGRDELEILGTGIAEEAAPIQSDKPSRAEGLTESVRTALSAAGLAMHDTFYRITDLNGEHYKFKEAAFVEGRLMQKKLVELYDLWHPNEYLGDVGAAIVPCVLGVAFHAGQKGYAPGPRALCHFSNDDEGLRVHRDAIPAGGADLMGANVFANGLEVSCEKATNQSLASMPDICLSPPSPPAGPVPIPYPNFSSASDTTNGASTVKIAGGEVGQKNKSCYKTSKGDEAATKGLGAGTTTGVIQGKCYFAAWSSDVKYEGENAVRLSDLTGSNHASPQACAANTTVSTGSPGKPPPDPKCEKLDEKNKEERKKVEDSLKSEDSLNQREQETLDKAESTGMTVSSAESSVPGAEGVFSGCSSGGAQEYNPAGLVEGGTSEQKLGANAETRNDPDKLGEAKEKAGVMCDKSHVHPGGGAGAHAEAKIMNHMSGMPGSAMQGGSMLFSIDWRFKREGGNSSRGCRASIARR